jgi:hypothetical protein
MGRKRHLNGFYFRRQREKMRLERKMLIQSGWCGFIISRSELEYTVLPPLDTTFCFTTIFNIPKC